MVKKSKVPGVSRVDSGKRHHGWRVYGWDQDAAKLRYLRFFSDNVYGGKLKARQEAEAYAKQHRPATKPRSRVKDDGTPTGVTIVRKADGTIDVRARIRVGGIDYAASYAVNEQRTLKEAIHKATQTRKAYERRVYGAALQTLKKKK